ncbi:MAG TPA: bifunctional DNA primase/polymerase [Thermoleophilia bacterium]|nr:bifunctional DNA primase/polymerase [Thermoleophilia bacterium]
MSAADEVRASAVAQGNGTVEAALDYAIHRNWAVLPLYSVRDGACTCGKADCTSPGKHPRTAHGLRDATTDAATITSWWQQWPKANVGVATGAASGFFALDVDGDAGEESLGALEDKFGRLPETVQSLTGGGGRHLLFAYPAAGAEVGSKVRVRPGLDVRGDGGYIVVPPSLHRSGRRYAWDEASPDALAPAPPWLLDEITCTQVARPEPTSALEGVGEGQRNDAIFREVSRLRALGVSKAEATVVARDMARKCRPPFPEREAMAIVERVWQKYQAPSTSPSVARVVRMADVAPQAVEWLWQPWIPLAKLTLLIGDPGTGKTMLALDLAARVTRGRPLPDGTRAPLGNVVILTAEDGLADTIRPRLDAAGADVGRVFALQAVRNVEKGEDKPFCLADDVEALEAVVNEVDGRLVIIDPLDAYLAGTDTHRNAEVRIALAPFAAMLERTGAAGLCVHHLNKDSSTVNALYRAGGSLAYVAAARSVLGVVPDPDDEEQERRLLLSIKLNIARRPDGIGYRVIDRGIAWDRDPVHIDAATAFAPKKADSDVMRTAKELLEEQLAGGRPVAQLLIEEAAAKAGISKAMLNKAKRALGVVSKRDGFGSGGLWYWGLPEDDSVSGQENA